MKAVKQNLLILLGLGIMALNLSPVFAQNQPLSLKSSAALVLDQKTGLVLYEKNAQKVVPIASITKLMTAMVLLDSKPDKAGTITIAKADIDTLRGSRSRLPVGTSLSLREMLRLALMSSENRAASALSRNFPGGKAAFVKAMNRKARALGMTHSHFRDPTGLYRENVSTARDLARLVSAAAKYPLIRQLTTTKSYRQKVGRKIVKFNNTNILTKNPQWKIGLSKTGFINESGKCLVMQTWLNNRPVIIVLLDSWGVLTPVGDSNRIKHWLDTVSASVYQGQG
ncbi:MAG: D-alanyl-D-alanine endopeptidase [Gammaproteobacteria bacterium HGW-Gammaproteobacteria-3]|nr:MAG: D-alanyl-D-alanine endopeptidase [Gammaproteobacteria bacterium HGW-Gammaproteobacteria-3]